MKKKVTCFLLVMTLVFASQAFAETAHPRVKMETSRGTIILELNPMAAPKTVSNFLTYVKAGFYNDTIFHRVIKGFMIQGGGMTSDMNKKNTLDPIKNEADNGLKNDVGTIAMARTNDPHSATAQFFINTVNNSMLNHTAKTGRGWGYCVFGKVVEGMDVVKAIEGVATTIRAGHRDVPAEPVIIKSVTIIEKKEPEKEKATPAKPQK